jgi:hypothetical protein
VTHFTSSPPRRCRRCRRKRMSSQRSAAAQAHTKCEGTTPHSRPVLGGVLSIGALAWSNSRLHPAREELREGCAQRVQCRHKGAKARTRATRAQGTQAHKDDPYGGVEKPTPPPLKPEPNKTRQHEPKKQDNEHMLQTSIKKHDPKTTETIQEEGWGSRRRCNTHAASYLYRSGRGWLRTSAGATAEVPTTPPTPLRPGSVRPSYLGVPRFSVG